jgi:hypothetical protein
MQGPINSPGQSPLRYAHGPVALSRACRRALILGHSFLLCANETAVPRKTLILEFLECGATCPTDEFFADRLQTLVVAEVTRARG